MAEKKLTEEQKAKLRIVTTEFRASHPHIFVPNAIKQGDKPNYSIEMLFDKETTDIKALNSKLLLAAKFKWGDDKANWPEPLTNPIKDGDKPKRNKKTGKVGVKPEHKGMYVVRATSNGDFARPHAVSKDPNVPLETAAQFYPGCYGRAYLTAHAYEFADKNGVKFILDGVQFIRDGQPLGGKKAATDMFGAIEGEESEPDFDNEFGADIDEEIPF